MTTYRPIDRAVLEHIMYTAKRERSQFVHNAWREASGPLRWAGLAVCVVWTSAFLAASYTGASQASSRNSHNIASGTKLAAPVAGHSRISGQTNVIQAAD
jgi:hypothetical protein